MPAHLKSIAPEPGWRGKKGERVHDAIVQSFAAPVVSGRAGCRAMTLFVPEPGREVGGIPFYSWRRPKSVRAGRNPPRKAATIIRSSSTIPASPHRSSPACSPIKMLGPSTSSGHAPASRTATDHRTQSPSGCAGRDFVVLKHPLQKDSSQGVYAIGALRKSLMRRSGSW